MRPPNKGRKSQQVGGTQKFVMDDGREYFRCCVDFDRI